MSVLLHDGNLYAMQMNLMSPCILNSWFGLRGELVLSPTMSVLYVEYVLLHQKVDA